MVALKAINKALKTLARTGPPPAGFESWEAWLLDRVTAFAVARRGQEQRYTPDPARWFDEGRYDDDPAAWGQGGQRKDDHHGTNGKSGANGHEAFEIPTSRRKP